MLQCEEPSDFVIATGESHSVQEFLDEAFGYLDMDWHEYVKIDPRFYRPNDVGFLQAEPAKRVLGWEPCVFFKDLVRIMVDADLELAGLKSPGEGAKIIEKHHGNWQRWDSQVVSMR
jgi:GDPmannose 4,6-dehydratase